jgi:predicted house-cleaning noncanonical NTP pyrophosphatase (MazG superfamily)
MAEKIIRDALVARIPADQIRRVDSREEHLSLLSAKTLEERDEIVAANFDDATEYADLLQVIMDKASVAGVAWNEIERARLAKLQERGGFLGGFVYNPAGYPTQRSSTGEDAR